MKRAAFLLFSSWVLILPFSVLSSIYFTVAGLSVDKVIAPTLIVVWLCLLLAGRVKLRVNRFFLLIHLLIFFFIRNISFLDNTSVFLESMWRDAILLAYFTLPVLYIDNINSVNTALKLVSINAVVGCVSAFLVALGVIELPYERFSDSRIGYAAIEKSIGFITSYGDVAQLAAFFLIAGLFMPDKLFPGGKITQRFVKLSVLLIVVMGLIGNQSRSYLLSVTLAYFVVLFFSYRSKRSTNTTLVDLLTFVLVVCLLPLMLLTASDLISSLAGMGGAQAKETADARLQQYQMAFSLIRENPLLGIGSEFYERYSDFAHGVHNLWIGQMTRGGLISTLLLFTFMFRILIGCIRLFRRNVTKRYAKVLIGYMAAVFVSTLFYPADSSIFWALLGICSAMIISLDSISLKKAFIPDRHSTGLSTLSNRT